MAAYPTMYQEGCRLLVAYSIMERRAWLEVQDRAAGTQNAGGIKIAEVDLGAVKMTDANLINTGKGVLVVHSFIAVSFLSLDVGGHAVKHDNRHVYSCVSEAYTWCLQSAVGGCEMK